MHPLQSDQIDLLSAALVAAQADLHDVAKTSTNTYLNTKYADLSAVRAAVVGPLAAKGLAVIQTFVPLAGDPIQFETLKSKKDRDYRVPTQVLGYLRTQLVHKSGQWIASELPLATVWGDSQTLGAAITYFRRYALAAMVGLAQEDDDGESAKGGFDRHDDRRLTSRAEPSDRPRRAGQPTPSAPAATASKPAAGTRPKTGVELDQYASNNKIDSNLKGWIVGNICKLGYPANITSWTPEQVDEAWPLVRRHLEQVKRTPETVAAESGANSASHANGNGMS